MGPRKTSTECGSKLTCWDDFEDDKVLVVSLVVNHEKDGVGGVAEGVGDSDGEVELDEKKLRASRVDEMEFEHKIDMVEYI